MDGVISDLWKKVYGQSYDAVKMVWLCGPPCQDQHQK